MLRHAETLERNANFSFCEVCLWGGGGGGGGGGLNFLIVFLFNSLARFV